VDNLHDLGAVFGREENIERLPNRFLRGDPGQVFEGMVETRDDEVCVPDDDGRAGV
jgi:hypothetical protein